MTIETRVKAALSMRDRFAWLKPAKKTHLIALKLYAGGYKSKGDIVELLARNPDLDLDAVRRVCAKYRLSGLDELIQEAS